MKDLWCILSLCVLWAATSVQADCHAITNPPQPLLCGCTCNCADKNTDGCEWKRVFKAVAGNGRNVLNDYTSGGDINGDVAEAKDIMSAMPFRDSHILDKWTQLGIEKVKVEVFLQGVRQTWFVFNGTDSDKNNWFAKGRLIDSPYGDIQSGPYNFFSIVGDSTVHRRFYINRHYYGCPNDCGFLDIVDTDSPKRVCGFDKRGAYPYFLFGKKLETCSMKERIDQTGKGDRFSISVKVCSS